MIPKNYSAADARRQYADAVKRAATNRKTRVTFGTVYHYAKQAAMSHPRSSLVWLRQAPSISPMAHPFSIRLACLLARLLDRKWVLPICSRRRHIAVSRIGRCGETTAIVKMASHIAAGKPRADGAITARRVLIFAVEETKNELDRKFGAAVHKWTNAERDAAVKNLRLISCQGKDVRLTKIAGRAVAATDIVDKMMQAAKEFEAQVIFLDHLQGFVSGDLNDSDTATALAMAANKIVGETKAAVVVTAHIGKANIGAKKVDDGFTIGSLAFENAARQVAGIAARRSG